MSCLTEGGQRPLGKGDIPVVFNTHNDRKLMPSFLAHYRGLGVTRFICVDDVSSDGTRDYLLAQADVDLWSSPVRYRDARRGREWREALFERYGWDRWYLNVDSDEFLIYEDCENRPLGALLQALESRGEKRLAAPMLDMYPPGRLGAATLDSDDGRMPWEIADHFDGSGYEISYTKRAISITGGPRKRKFAHLLELIKYPVIFWDKECSLGVSIHQPLPCERNFPAVSGVLLHFKFFSDYKEKIDRQSPTGSTSTLRPSTARCWWVFRRRVNSTFPMHARRDSRVPGSCSNSALSRPSAIRKAAASGSAAFWLLVSE